MPVYALDFDTPVNNSFSHYVMLNVVGADIAIMIFN